MTNADKEGLAGAPLGSTSRRRFLQGAAGTARRARRLAGRSGHLLQDGRRHRGTAGPARWRCQGTSSGAIPPSGHLVINVDGSGLQHKHGPVAVHVPPCTTTSLRRRSPYRRAQQRYKRRNNTWSLRLWSLKPGLPPLLQE